MHEGPLAGRYPAVAAMVVFALVPYLALSAALGPITPIIAGDLNMSLQAVAITSGMANAGYAVGTVLAVQFAQKRPQRRMLLVYGTLLLIGSVLTAAADSAAMFIIGHVLQGLCTSLLLIAAVPPLITGYPAARLRETAVIMNVCIFGAVALGPVLGGIQASSNGWRPLFWAIAGVAAAALVLSVLTFQDTPPVDPGAPIDWIALSLAVIGCAAAFFGASELLTHPFVDATTIGPLLGGLLVIVILFVHEYTAKRPLLCVRSLISTLPVAGIVAAICAAAASVSAISLTETVLAHRFSDMHLGLLYLPEFGGAVITAVTFGIVFRTRFLHYYVLVGLAFLAVGIAVMNAASPPTSVLVGVGSGLVGIGVGSSVVPALFIAGFSLRSPQVQRVFAIVELIRAVAAFMIAPVLLYVAATVGSNADAGTRTALWICFWISITGGVIGVALYAAGGVRPPKPSVDAWMTGQQPGWYSPPLLTRLRRRGPSDEDVDACP
ncbi:Major Facilitator Superfamily protein [Actinacidiphila yanglinensis]|uniref:Major Facilitator Superfamily protein n=1 Tax=Actinacidiphila yanglinensis TaxID=310779 RepID=A0A1H6AJX6_9ACTN|nr:MFS transporter [Actinacidiphila yanglinensis]SEG48315.1 Major Facilitator Superfamily protein [Actinacidiphila yanglinensis]